VSTKASSLASATAEAYTIGATLALSTGASEGIAQIEEDLTSLDRILSASDVRLEYLVQLAERVRGLGTQHPTRSAAHLVPLLPRALPAPYSEPDAVARFLSSPTRSEAAHEGLQQQVLAHAGLPPQPVSVTRATTENPPREMPPMPSLSAPLATAAQKHLSAAPIMPVTDVSFTRDSQARQPDATDHPPTVAPDGRLRAIGAMLTDVPLDAIQNADFAPVAPAHMTIARTAPRAIDAFGVRSTPASGTAITAALSQASLVMPQLAPGLALPAPQLAPSMGSVAPSDVARTAETGGQVVPTEVSRSHSESRQSMETAAEPRRGTIILDGALLGRWVADRLARQASRPVAGTTGIDPRINPTFPGAPISI
jgi:hypothetical protein